jgi:Ca2+/Na+ antiporter
MILSAILLAFAAFLGLVMELYKKSLRRDRASENEIKLVALACSALLGYVTFRIVAGAGMDGGLNPTPYLVVLYTIVIYLLQLPACMAFWKPLVKKFMERKADE